MNCPVRTYPYVGPAEISARVGTGPAGFLVAGIDDLEGYLSEQSTAEAREPFTFVVTERLRMLLAPRRTEHVMCAAGALVASAGEVSFRRTTRGWSVVEISNQSTGYCPQPESWAAVEQALDGIGISHPGGFTDSLVFRICAPCGNINVVREGHFVCAVCDQDLPRLLPCPPALH